MSIPVAIEDLERTLREYGAGYLLTTAAGRVKAVTVEPRVVGGALEIDGRSGGSARNLADEPAATLLFPPTEPRGYTLLVDGYAEARDDGFRFTPATAVLHRPASHADGPPPPAGAGEGTDCGNDCHPL